MLEMTRSFDNLASSRNNGNKLASSRNNNIRPASGRNNSNGEVNDFRVGGNDIEHAKKSEKLFKLGKSKSKKTFKSQNLAKSEKICHKVGIQLILILQRPDQSFSLSMLRQLFIVYG